MVKNMKIYMYSLRKFDELKYCKKYKEEKQIDFAYTTEYPSLENLSLAKGYDAISMTPCDINADMIEKLHDYGVKYIICRSIGYDHVDLKKAKECGIRVSNVDYSPNGVANYTILLMLMCLRRMGHILKRTELQDYSLKEKIGRDIRKDLSGNCQCRHQTDRDRRKEAVDRGVPFWIFRKCIRGKSPD